MTTTPDDLRGEARELFDRWRRLGVSETTALQECKKAGLVEDDGADRATAAFERMGMSEEAARSAATRPGRYGLSAGQVLDGAREQRDLEEARRLREKRRRQRARSKPSPAPVHRESGGAGKAKPETVRVRTGQGRASIAWEDNDGAEHVESVASFAEAERRASELRGS